MRTYTLAHLSDDVLVRDLTAIVARDRATTAALLAHLAEVDARRLYVPAGYPSMHAYCVGELRFSDDAAFKRILVARAAPQSSEIFAAIADGRLHMTAVRYLAPYLTAENADELLAAAADRNTVQIEALIAGRFGHSGSSGSARLTAILPSPAPALASEPARGLPEPTAEQVLRPVESATECPTDSAATSAERYMLQLAIGRTTRDKLQYAQSLLGHSVPSSDLSRLLDRALDALIARLEKQIRLSIPQRRRSPVDRGYERPRSNRRAR